jgi:hypothetical protein
MTKITTESLYKEDPKVYPKYRNISRNVAMRLCSILPKIGREIIIGKFEGNTLFLQNISGHFRTWVYYDGNHKAYGDSIRNEFL